MRGWRRASTAPAALGGQAYVFSVDVVVAVELVSLVSVD